MDISKVPPRDSKHKPAVEAAFRRINESLSSPGYQPERAAGCERDDAADVSTGLTLDDLQLLLFEQLASKPRAKDKKATPLQIARLNRKATTK